jgi:major type 1 subunit fimbrin (pilin)
VSPFILFNTQVLLIMKNSMIAMTIAALMAGAAAPAAMAAASGTTVSGGTINFEGQVVDAACSVSADSVNQTVTLGQVRTAKLSTAGDVSGQKTAFNINLEDCDTTVSTNAAVTFTGQQDSTTAGALANSGGTATNVALQLYGPDGNTLKIGTESAAVTLLDGDNALPFSVDYIATGGAATAGSVSTTATFSLHYS